MTEGPLLAHALTPRQIVSNKQLKWKPIQHDTWEDPQGNTWQLHAEYDKPFPMMTVIHAIIDSYHEYMVPNAAKHFDGSSITGAIAWDTTLAHNQTLKNKKKYP